MSFRIKFLYFFRYCAKLPSDIFTRLVPDYRTFPAPEGGFLAEIDFPINSPIKKTIVLTKPAATKEFALMGVALKVFIVKIKFKIF